jgi:hypothetical protein
MMRPADVMAAETVTIDMVNRTVETADETLPVVWWGDEDMEPCPFEQAAHMSAGPDRDGLYVQIALDVKQGRVQ